MKRLNKWKRYLRTQSIEPNSSNAYFSLLEGIRYRRDIKHIYKDYVHLALGSFTRTDWIAFSRRIDITNQNCFLLDNMPEDYYWYKLEEGVSDNLPIILIHLLEARYVRAD